MNPISIKTSYAGIFLQDKPATRNSYVIHHQTLGGKQYEYSKISFSATGNS